MSSITNAAAANENSMDTTAAQKSSMNAAAAEAATVGIASTEFQDKLAAALKAVQLEAKINKSVRDQVYNDLW